VCDERFPRLAFRKVVLNGTRLRFRKTSITDAVHCGACSAKRAAAQSSVSMYLPRKAQPLRGTSWAGGVLRLEWAIKERLSDWFFLFAPFGVTINRV